MVCELYWCQLQLTEPRMRKAEKEELERKRAYLIDSILQLGKTVPHF